MATEHQTKLTRFRRRRDDLFASGGQSPLSPDQQASFSGIDYFPESTELVFELPLATDGPGVGERVAIQTTSGHPSTFVRAGRITFPVGEETATLTVFRDEGGGGLFLPFRDATSGTETYEGGRYLDPRPHPNGTLTVDFNYAYNPYCAYGPGWSCPIPPDENTLTVKIEAGEKAFTGETEDRGHHHHHH